MMQIPEEKVLVMANIVVAVFLTGLIWTIQVVHYPSFRHVGESQFIEFQHRHMRNISYIVVPLMLIEVFLGISLQLSSVGKSEFLGVTIANILLLLIWIVTFAISSPIHGQLATKGFDIQLINKLVDTNWIRTAAWTLRTGILTYLGLRL